MNCFFDRERMMTVYCGVEEPRCVRLAAQDLCGDLRKLSGREAALCDRAPAAQTEDALLVATLGTAAAELPGDEKWKRFTERARFPSAPILR